MHSTVLLTALALSLASAEPILHKRASTVSPVVAGTPSVVAVVEDPTFNRDSCTSTRVGDRELWTCRDTISYSYDTDQFFLGSSASWTNFTSSGQPDIVNGNLTCYGNNNEQAYFPPAADECPSSPGAGCPNGTRWLLWPDTRPLPVTKDDGSVSLYTWIRRVYINTTTLGALNGNPPTVLYRSDYEPSQALDELPPVTMVDESFYAPGQISFGDYGWVLNGTTAYLYGPIANSSGIALAKVDVSTIEDFSTYYFYHPSDGSWDQNVPSVTDTSQAIPNAGTGQQGTFYYSDYFGSYVWIGSPDYGDNSVFVITTAPAPEGPWSTPTEFYTGPSGNLFNGYSQQAHPGLSTDQGNGKDIYISYTIENQDSAGNGYYVTNLAYVQWQ